MLRVWVRVRVSIMVMIKVRVGSSILRTLLLVCRCGPQVRSAGPQSAFNPWPCSVVGFEHMCLVRRNIAPAYSMKLHPGSLMLP